VPVPRTVEWPIGEHTLGKHLVLKEYLKAWIPILGMTVERMLFIDGFAGPGRYRGGEEGSPVIAIKSLIEHASRSRIRAQVNFLFIEQDPRRAMALEQAIAPLRANMPSSSQVEVLSGGFSEHMGRLFARLDEAQHRLAPAFMMIDPFGVKDVPLDVLRRFFQNDKSEAYISFMYESMNRFDEAPEFSEHLDALFGTDEWRGTFRIDDPDDRKQAVYALYERQLRAAGARHVVYFELFDAGRHVYTLFFATKHALGCDRMKQAMWKAAPDGNYRFVGSRMGQQSLDLTASVEPLLARELVREFSPAGMIGVELLTRYLQSDRSDFHSGQLKRTLKYLEERGGLQIERSDGRRRRAGTYPDGTRLRFLPEGASPSGTG
jgi:three-Cys-motif partner protein